MGKPEVIIYHNPNCTKSRATLAMLQERALDPTVVSYLDGALTIDDLNTIKQTLGVDALVFMRPNEQVFKDLNLDEHSLSDDDRFKAILENPILLQRPIVVVDGKKAAIGRPPEDVIPILP